MRQVPSYREGAACYRQNAAINEGHEDAGIKIIFWD
jgi:hypothetical protein